MKEEEGRSTFERVSALEWMVGIPELTQEFEEETLALLERMDRKGHSAHRLFLLELIRRQEAFVKTIQVYCHGGIFHLKRLCLRTGAADIFLSMPKL